MNVPGCSTIIAEMWLLRLRLLASRVMIILLSLFVLILWGARRKEFPLPGLPSLTFSILGPVSSNLSLLVGGTKMTLFQVLEKVLHEERE